MFDAAEILNSLPEIIFIVDTETKQIIYINKAAKRLMGNCIGKNRDAVFKSMIKTTDDTMDTSVITAVNGNSYAIHKHSDSIDGREVTVEVAIDVTEADKERKELKKVLRRCARSEKSLRIISYTDTLTGIYNRNKFIDDCEEMSRNGDTNVGVVFMDLNSLKEINDTKGHYTGDEALKCIADIIVDIFGEDNVYRVGGDEFVAIYRGGDKNAFDSLLEKLMGEFDESDYKAAVGAKYSASGPDIYQIVKIADDNMYRDKKSFYRNGGGGRRYRMSNDTYASVSAGEKIKKPGILGLWRRALIDRLRK